ncbi:MAG: glucosamine-6-phosphate deaminase [Oscillospiraceae bacterium]|nr:glucosamine-6-phosphate deaminase [Oscillospiraceae bacterium]
MKIIYAKDYDSMSRKAANIISAQVILKPNSVLGLATGSSPIGIYKQLIEWYEKGDLDFSACHTVNLDEYVGLDKTNDQSYAYFMYHNFFKDININMENTNVPNGTNTDAAGECARYNKVIQDLGGIDIQLLGIGHNGHIGFNEPGIAFEKETHCVELTQKTIDANTRFFNSKEEVPTHAYTMGIKNIMNAKKILLVACGAEKAEILYRMVTGKIEPSVPASILQLHNDVTIVADEAALTVINEKAPYLIERLPSCNKK